MTRELRRAASAAPLSRIVQGCPQSLAAIGCGDRDTKLFGWTVRVGTEPTPVELRFADAGVASWSNGTTDQLATIPTGVSSLRFAVGCLGRDAAGLLPSGTGDAGDLEIDEVAFFE